ncbi:MAG: hypothetical protein GY765_30740 [bacterium]|nr:hypothetical protein [bacterium]
MRSKKDNMTNCFKMKSSRIVVVLISLLSLYLVLGILSAAQSDYPEANSSCKAVEKWAEAYARMDFEALAFYMHPEALMEFKQLIILQGWGVAKLQNKDSFVSIIKGITSKQALEKAEAPPGIL